MSFPDGFIDDVEAFEQFIFVHDDGRTHAQDMACGYPGESLAERAHVDFAAGLGGFHEYRYSVRWGEDLIDPEWAREAAAAMGHGFFVIRKGAGRPLEVVQDGGTTG